MHLDRAVLIGELRCPLHHFQLARFRMSSGPRLSDIAAGYYELVDTKLRLRIKICFQKRLTLKCLLLEKFVKDF